MKKILIIVAGVAFLGIALWSGMWFVGRGQIEDQLDLELARAEAQGRTITWESRSIGGFPFGYEMHAENVAVTFRDSGILIRVPEVVSNANASDINRIDTRLLGEILVDIPISEEQRAADPSLPKIAKLKINGDRLIASVEGMAADNRRITVSADEILAKLDQEDLDGKVDIGASGGNTVFTTQGSKSTLGISADAVAINIIGAEQGGQVPTVDAGIDTLSVTATVDAPVTRNLNEIVFGNADGSVEIVYNTGRIASETNLSDETGQGGGRFSFYGGTATGIIGIQSGRIELRSESRQNAWTVQPKQPDAAITGSLTADAVQTHYIMPTGPTETPADARLRLAIIDLNGDETFWKSLDPEGVLDRSSSELLLDVDATTQITGRLDQMQPGRAVPVQLSNISVNTLNLSALGGEVNASGDVEVLQPINLPMGALKVSLSNANAVLLALKQAGLIDEQIRATGAAMLQVYARPADGEDQWETDVTFGNDGIEVNGLRVQ